MKWVVIAVGILVALGALGYVRNSVLPRRRLEKLLSDHGVDFLRVRSRPVYAWPGYIVEFHSEEARIAFQGSEAFKALLGQVQLMHAGLHHGDQRFDARMAVSLHPTSLPGLG
ncbi:MAG: hypothetical protein QOI66_1482 [Myxococcales bacterium]|nr:hypothetical protein [Myxococcales bacterium]